MFISVCVNESISYTICGLCSKSYNDPRILPCLHSFCQQCLHHEIEESDSQQVFKCPTCQRSMSIPVGGASGLPQNLHLGFEVEVAGYMSKIVGNSEVCCDECIDGGSGLAEVFCCTCRQFLCKTCHDHHKRGRHLSKHSMVGLDQEGAKQLQSTMKPKEYYCSQRNHEDNKLNYYCETCTLLVCRDCTTLAHKDHGVTELSTVAEAHRGEMRGTLQHVQDTLADAFGANQKKMEQVEVSKHEGELAIKQAFEQLHEALEERKKALLSELGTIALTQTTALTLQKEQLEEIQQDISHYPEVISHILQTHTDHEVVTMGGLVPTELKATLKMVEKVNIATNHYGPITAQMPTESLVKELSTCGGVYDQSPVASQSNVTFPSVIHANTKCRLMLETKVFNGERYPHGGVKVQAEMRSKDRNGAVVFGEVEDHRDGTYTITLTPPTAGPHQLLLTVDGQHVQNRPRDLHVSDYRTIKKDQNKKELIKCSGIPLCVAIHDDSGDIYAGCQDGNIYVFDKTGQPKNIIGRPNSSWKPSSICINGDEMYVLDHHEVHKLTLKGEILLTFGRYGSRRGEFSCPTAVIVDSSKRVIVSDSYNDRIQIFDQNGSWISTINGKCEVSGVYCFKYPKSLALDPQGNIHVAYQSDAIKVFTIEGTYVRWYGHPDLNRPKQVAIDTSGYSLACADGLLVIFDPQGNHLHTVSGGKYTIAALDSIRGHVFAVTADGNIYKYSI